MRGHLDQLNDKWLFQSLNIPMSGKAIDTLMKKLDVDDDGEIDFA